MTNYPLKSHKICIEITADLQIEGTLTRAEAQVHLQLLNQRIRRIIRDHFHGRITQFNAEADIYI